MIDWLEKWASACRSANGTIPVEPDIADDLPGVIEVLETDLRPASEQEFMVAIDRLVAFAQTFGLPNINTKMAYDIWREALVDLPADLLTEAVARTIRGHKYHVLPKPADIRERIEDDLIRRRGALFNARWALKAPVRQAPRPPPTEEEKRRVDDLVKSIKRMP